MLTFFRILFFLIPWVMIPNGRLADPFRIPKAVFFDLLCIGIICFSLTAGLKKRYVNKYLSWLVIWIFFIIVINFYLPFSFSFNNRQTIALWTIEPMLHFILGLFASYIILSSFEKEDYIKIASTICFSSFVIASVGILQRYGVDIFGKIAIYNHNNRICAFLDNPNIFGNYLCLSLPFFLAQKENKYIVGFLIVSLALILSKSTLSLFCALVGFYVYIMLRIKEKKIPFFSFIVFGISLISLIIYKYNYLIIHFGDYRLDLWKIAWVRFKENPIFGQGLGIVKTWGLKIPNVESVWLELHNDWLETAIEIGVIGIALLLLVIGKSIRKFNYQKDNLIGYVYFSSFISFLILMGGAFPLRIAPLALFGLLNWWAVETL